MAVYPENTVSASGDYIVKNGEWVSNNQTTAPNQGISGGDVVRELLQGATFQFGDELRGAASGALGALMGQGDYLDLYRLTRDAERRKQQQFAEDNPLTSAALQMTGGLLTAVPGAIRVGSTKLVKPAVDKARNWVSQGGTGKKILKTGTVAAPLAAGEGFISGAGGSENTETMLRDAVASGMTAGAIGGLFGLTGRSAIELGRKEIQRFDPLRRASQEIRKTLGRADMTVDDAIEATDVRGPDAILADTSEAAREALEDVANQPGRTRGEAIDQLTRRSRNQDVLLLDELGPGRKYETIEKLAEQRRLEVSPIYEKAYAEGITKTENLESIYQRLKAFDPNFFKDAKQISKLEGAGEFGSEARPKMRGWNLVQRKLRDLVDSSFVAGRSEEALRFKRIREELLTELDKNTNYKKARKLWSDSKSFADNILKARRFMTMPDSEFRELTKDMSKADLEAVKIGAIQAIEDRVQSGRLTADVTRLFDTRAMQNKLKRLFSDPDEFVDFKNRLKILGEEQRTLDAVRGGSATARRLAKQQDSSGDWIDDALQLAESTVTGRADQTARAGAGFLRRGLRRVDPMRGVKERTRDQIGDIMLETDPVKRAILLRQFPELDPNFVPLGRDGSLTLPIGAGLLGGQVPYE